MLETAVMWTVLAAAPEPVIEIEWSAPAGCPSAEEVAARVDALAEVGVEARRDGRAIATVTREGEGWRLVLDLRFPAGSARRELDGDGCDVLADAAALMIAVMLDPQSVLDELQETPAPAGSPPPVTPPVARKRGPIRGLLGVTGAGTFAALPRFGGGLVAAAGLEGRWFRAEAVAAYEAPQVRNVDSGAGARLDLWTVGARGCGVPGPPKLQVPLCVGVEFGAVRATGVGLSAPRRTQLFHGQLAAGPGISYRPVAWLGLTARADAIVTLRPWRIVIDDLGDVYSSRPAGIRLGLGVEFILAAER